MNPLVSVIIPTYNRTDLLREAIDSALAQTYRPIEIVVIDDGSTEPIQPAIASYDGQIKLIRQANAGPAAARNNGIRASSGELIALLDSDDRWLPDKLTRQVPLFEKNSQIGLVHAKVRFFNHETGEILGHMFSGENQDVHDVLSHKMIATQTAVFRRELFDKIGGFDESLLGPEDFDFFVRAAANCRTVGLPEVLAEARQHGSQYSASLDRMFRCQMRVVDKHRNLHVNCEPCRVALAELDRFYREAYCRRIFDAARQAGREGKPMLAMQLRLRGLTRNPRMIWGIPAKVAGRLSRTA